MTIKYTALLLLSIFGTALHAMEKNRNAQLTILQTNKQITQKQHNVQLVGKTISFYSVRNRHNPSQPLGTHTHAQANTVVKSYPKLQIRILPPEKSLASHQQKQSSKPFLPNRPDLSGRANKKKRRIANRHAKFQESEKQERLNKILAAEAKAAVALNPLTKNQEPTVIVAISTNTQTSSSNRPSDDFLKQVQEHTDRATPIVKTALRELHTQMDKDDCHYHQSYAESIDDDIINIKAQKHALGKSLYALFDNK